MRSAIVFISIFSGILLPSLTLTACSSLSSSKDRPVIYAAGDKATVGSLVYTVTDTERTQQLGDDPSTARTPQNRFYLIKVSISNSGGDEQPIPAMTLVDDAGESYGELADGTNVPKWLGVVRKVGAAQTEEGVVVFDAPAKHYRLRLNDPFDEKEIAIDVPLDFVHEQSLRAPPPSAAVQIPIPGK
jgi:hypothetical protein